ncbi:DASS family sodium-coupled anion symporter [Oricola sp.]|uniref:SLC13 family permease n=1 Tax=Oricola sp. TaxID=1979950 RepID=UPI0025D65E9A|nr:DASS family sodium-coupled anion symporter [Oricola sp.]MCI5076230.1 DASS family sodium-coupled anion symporter [Oricola sp.]
MGGMTRAGALIWIALAIILVLTVAGPFGGLSREAQAAAAIGLAMAILWVSEAVPLAVTALLPLVLFPLFGIASIADLGSSYANPVIFLFLGGFLIARAIETWALHRRLAFTILSRTSGDPAVVILAVMGVTAFLSLWISNTAATMVIAPIAASLAALRETDRAFATALMLGTAYAATIGGMGSLIGTPPNALFAAYMQETHNIVIGFAEWMLVGLPVVLVLLPITWLVLTRWAFRPASGHLRTDFARLDAMSTGEIRVALVSGLTALGWIARPVISEFAPSLGLTDAGIAMTGAVALFMLPSGGKDGKRLLDWQAASSLRWDVLILFGGGLALASAIDSTGLAAWIGDRATALQAYPVLAILVILALVIVYLGELASNTAMAAIFLPVAGAMAVALGADPLTFALPVAMAASIGFMLPVATPPNAIVFANPAVTRQSMIRAGTPLDLIGIMIALGAGALLGPMIF